MSKSSRIGRLTVVCVAAALGLSACGSASSSGESGGSTITIGVISSTSGPYEYYGKGWVEGFEAGLEYVTDGTMEIDGHPIKLSINDDGGDPAQAVTQATDLAGNGVKILAGTISSAVALQLAPFAEENDMIQITGSVAGDSITGLSRNTFRATPQTGQLLLGMKKELPVLDGGKLTILVQETAYGKDSAAIAEEILGADAASVETISVPESATDVTPYALQVAQSAPDVLYTTWVGPTTANLWQSLAQQGVSGSIPVVSPLAVPPDWPSYGQDASKIQLTTGYYPGAGEGAVADAIAELVEEPGRDTAAGFAAAQMVEQAIKAGADDTEGMISALEGFSFDYGTGEATVRAEDHAILVPIFNVNLVGDPTNRSVEVLSKFEAEDVAPPEVATGWAD